MVVHPPAVPGSYRLPVLPMEHSSFRRCRQLCFLDLCLSEYMKCFCPPKHRISNDVLKRRAKSFFSPVLLRIGFI